MGWGVFPGKALDRGTIRAGVFIGVGMGGLENLENCTLTLKHKGPKRISPYLIPSLIANMAAGQISIAHDFRGPSFAHTSACSSSAHAIGEAMRWIQYGRADVMVAGGAAGYVMRKTHVPIPPLVIAMLLAPGLENNIRQSLSLSDGSYAVFVQSPIAAVLLFVTLVVFAFFAWRSFYPSPMSQPLKGQSK